MGGLASALAFARKGFKHIDVYENAPNLGFVGAGIQMPPNVICVLDHLGCWAEIEKDCTDVKATSIRRESDLGLVRRIMANPLTCKRRV